MIPNWLLLWPDQVALSLLVLLSILIPLLYAMRKPAHGVIRSLSYLLGNPLRLAGRWLLLSAAELRQRNKTVLLAHGREEVGQHIEREFERVSQLIKRDLQAYPALQRRLIEEITRIEEDYQKCSEVPPTPPDWIDALAAVAKIKSNGSEMVQRLLEEIKRSITDIHEQQVAEYRRSYEHRHKILKGFMPFWRSLDKTLSQVDKNVTGLQNSSASIDAQMEKYEQIEAKTDKAEHALTSSGVTQFIIASLVMLIVLGGAFINFKLIALPMSEMVGASDYLTSRLRTSEVAALVIILLETSMGLFLMESLRITHLFPRIANMNDKMRRRMVVVSLTFLIILAGIESALALMRDMLVADKQALLQSLAVTQAQHTDGWLAVIPTAGQMILGFVLPFVLAFAAIPLETFISSLRTVAGAVLVIVMRTAGFVLRTAGYMVRQLGTTLILAYDAVVIVPLLVERVVRIGRGTVAAKPMEAEAYERN